MPTTMIAETPKGSRNRDERDHETGQIHLDRMLLTATHNSADHGFYSHAKPAQVGWRRLSDALQLIEQARERAF